MATPPEQPAKGTVVRVHSLVGRPELNGRRGVVVTAFNPDNGRIGIKIDDEEKPLALKPANLESESLDQSAQAACDKLDAVKKLVSRVARSEGVSDPVLHDVLAGVNARFDPNDTSEEALIHAVARVWNSDGCTTPKDAYRSLTAEGQWDGHATLADVAFALCTYVRFDRKWA